MPPALPILVNPANPANTPEHDLNRATAMHFLTVNTYSNERICVRPLEGPRGCKDRP